MNPTADVCSILDKHSLFLCNERNVLLLSVYILGLLFLHWLLSELIPKGNDTNFSKNVLLCLRFIVLIVYILRLLSWIVAWIQSVPTWEKSILWRSLDIYHHHSMLIMIVNKYKYARNILERILSVSISFWIFAIVLCWYQYVLYGINYKMIELVYN